MKFTLECEREDAGRWLAEASRTALCDNDEPRPPMLARMARPTGLQPEDR